jgi:hypothetical protein
MSRSSQPACLRPAVKTAPNLAFVQRRVDAALNARINCPTEFDTSLAGPRIVLNGDECRWCRSSVSPGRAPQSACMEVICPDRVIVTALAGPDFDGGCGLSNATMQST